MQSIEAAFPACYERSRSLPADLQRQVARFRTLVREGVVIACASLRANGHLDVTIRLEDGREGRFLVIFLDQDGQERDHAPVLLVEQADDQSSDDNPSNCDI